MNLRRDSTLFSYWRADVGVNNKNNKINNNESNKIHLILQQWGRELGLPWFGWMQGKLPICLSRSWCIMSNPTDKSSCLSVCLSELSSCCMAEHLAINGIPIPLLIDLRFPWWRKENFCACLNSKEKDNRYRHCNEKLQAATHTIM